MQGLPAHQQQNKGTLIPGQTISVNKYTVQVERYLSQGGFAHVYLVRTAAPVYNTTHHVLKRIAVHGEAMLTDVKKEVDIMRLLKGHPNIVHLIDAAWHRMSNGLYEVFILMEFCPGGGIIDMMNRRLRERLTEAEILQIFVDVCEGVAYMHNSRPPLLHRDLKVENILQASPVSFKLCDFGSAATAATRPPQTVQEFRALEDDLNRHTTMQYRAPEMIDVHMRRPVDEKSDVWALGVLLFKLCYYTTPFEEHGPLAILNVQYKTPPYPIYSSHMRELIASMLREHGTHRPTVFEILNQVHRLRGTKSQFQYNVPAPKPLSPRQSTFKPSPPPSNNLMGSTISYRQAPVVASSVSPKIGTSSPASVPLKNPGVQARDKVLEAIAPMRRGRPTAPKDPSSSRQASPEKDKSWLEDENKAWEAVSKKAGSDAIANLDDAFSVPGKATGANRAGQKGFGDDFAERLWNAPDPNSQTVAPAMQPPASFKNPPLKASIARVASLSRTRDRARAIPTAQREKDAFDSLGFGSSEEKPAPTLAEARKLRTGLAAPMTSQDPSNKFNQANRPELFPNLSYTSSTPSQTLVPPPLKPSGSGSSWSSQPPSRPGSSHQTTDFPAETRFPSLAELDASFAPKQSNKRSSFSMKPGPHASSQPQLAQATKSIYASEIDKTTSGVSRVVFPDPSKAEEKVTPYAILGAHSTPNAENRAPSTSLDASGRRPSIIRRHRSSITFKHVSQSDVVSPTSPYLPSSVKEQPLTQEKVAVSKMPQKDWLTGDDDSLDHDTNTILERRSSPPPSSAPMVRNSPSKRASFIEKSHIPLHEGLVATQERIPSPPPKDRLANVASSTYSSIPDSPSTRAHRIFPKLDTKLDTTAEPAPSVTDTRSLSVGGNPSRERKGTAGSLSSADEEGPEEADRYVPSRAKFSSSEPKSIRPQRKGRQSSVHDLVDLYGGGLSPTKERDRGNEATRSIGTPLPSKPTSNEHRPVRTLASPAMPMESRRKSVSPKPITSPSVSESPATRQSPRSPIVANPTTTSYPRSRPQSMFIFPSKSSDGSTSSSTGLVPPPDTEPQRHTRRTSISDMVQRFEAIDAVAKGSVLSAIPSKPQRVETDSDQNSVPVAKRGAQSNGKATSSETHITGLTKSRIAAQPALRVSPSALTKILPSPTPEPEKPREPEVVTPRPRRISIKPDSSNTVLFPVSRSSSHTESTTPSTNARSSSPERPYQGVGKLIDQWQRKTAETESPIPKRGGYAPKRVGLVNGQSRGQ
ncbi:hypothetical protein E1B28_001502 [Marasmius oreades]|uniref:non-specific serine/threonine protein kinase n=1 Tax=Marasmius oreades TaxID=181124 RepID=A0A9P7V3Q3_9AGAR|nr:uncharacterized protein E1B28_001502 [Marasmius oreades]KAG7099678.1 hypothetical protein E1B28_001502 [Marasmius oreades]